MDILTYAPIILLVVMLVLLALILKKLAGQKIDPAAISARFDDLLKGQERTELKTHEEMARSREELGRMSR
ncbi:MAG: hypothetical protein J0652_07320, partial [Desulfobulbaceae bacterium]|nr:hypothetical protein [Desulfobulbaceae bacterium]